MINNIYDGNDTYLSLKNQYQDKEINTSLLSKLAVKCSDNRDPIFCEDVYSTIINSSEITDKDILFKAKLFFASQKLSLGEIQSSINLLNEYKNNYNTLDLYRVIIRHFSNTGDVSSESKYYKEMTDTFKDNPSILNGYAWRMTELGINLSDALNKANLAINLAEDVKLKSYILDTKAEVLWILGRIQEALDTIDLAISIDPSSDYFREQREKFKASMIHKTTYE